MFSKEQTEHLFLASTPHAIENLTPSQSFTSLIDWYESNRSRDALPISEDGDALLFQWGTYNRTPQRTFELNLTRQLIYPDVQEEADLGFVEREIWQLGLTYLYEPSAGLDALGSGEAWCFDPADVTNFVSTVLESKAIHAIANSAHCGFEMSWEQC